MVNCLQFCFNFAFKFNLRRYIMVAVDGTKESERAAEW